MNKRFLTLAAFVILLVSFAVGLSVSGAPNFGIDKQQSFGTYVWVGNDITIASSYKWGEAPWSMSFYVNVRGSSPGQLTDVLVICNDDAGHVLTSTSTLEPQRLADDRTQYTIDGYCTYESATTADNYPEIRVVYRGVTYTRAVNIIVWESVGSIDVRLEVEPLTSTETTDIVMTATVTGEAGEATSDTECKFWNDHAAAVAFADVDNDDVDDPVLAPGVGAADTGVAVYADHLAATDGEFTAAVACQRNGQEDTAHVPYTIYPDTISIQSFTATPASGTNPLDDVVLEAAVTTTCDSTGNIQFQFDCDVGSGVDDNDTVAIADYVDENGLITFASDDVGADDCDGYAASTTATVVVDCENAVQAAAATPIEIVVGTTFSFESSTSPSGGVEPLNTVHPWVGAWGGTATGDITIDSVDCNTGLGNTEGVDYFSAGYNIGDLSSSYNLFQQGISCDYATDAVYEGDVDATRDGISFTTTFYVTVTPQSTAPIFQLSETSFNRSAVVGANANDVVFTVGNVGGGNLEWVGVDDATWLACTPDDYTDQAPVAGPANGESEEITCTITSSTLGTGSYSATIIYTDPNATPTTPDTPVTVNLNVTEPVSTLIHLEVDLNLATTGGSIASGPSPLAVSFSTVDISDGVNHVDYTGDTRHEDSTVVPFTDLYYEWDFGDAGCPQGDLGDCRWDAVATNRLSRNYMTGPLGAHVYEPATFPDTCTGAVACKIYYPTLRVTDEDGNLASWSGTVNVYDPDATGANGWGDAGETVCIYPNAGAVGAGCPAVGTAYQSPADDFDADLTTRIAAGYQRILFQGGGTWDMDAEYKLEDAQAGMIGAYGTGDVIVDLNLIAGTRSAFNISADNWRIQDITFIPTVVQCDGYNDDDALFVSFNDLTQTTQVQNLLIQRTTAVGSGFCVGMIFSSSYADSGPDSQSHRQLFLVDNEWREFQKYQIYAFSNGFSILGNTFESLSDVAIAVHNIRILTAQRLLVSNNKIINAHNDEAVGSGGTGCALTMRDRPMGDCLCTGCTRDNNCKPLCGKPIQYYLVQDNDIAMRPPCGFAVGLEMCGFVIDNEMPEYDFIFERNYFYPNPDGWTGMGQFTSVIDTDHTMNNAVIRNNVADTGGTWNYHRFIDRGSDTDFFNNTCYRSDSRTDTTMCIQINGTNTGECRNNVFYAPNYAGTKDVILGSCGTETTNFDNGATGGITGNPFHSLTPTTRWGFWPKTSELQNQATEVPTLFDDAINTCGDRGDAGALEYPYAAGDGPVDGVPGCR